MYSSTELTQISKTRRTLFALRLGEVAVLVSLRFAELIPDRQTHPLPFGCEDRFDHSLCLLVWKVQRVAPYGSEVPRAKIVSGLTPYTCHGGGPALGAL